MPSGTVTWDDTQMLVKCAKIRSKLPAFAGAALFAEIDQIEVPEAKRLVPVKEGDLRDTIRAVGPFFEGGRISAGITAGGIAPSGRDVDYAEKVHEDLEAFHPNGQAKFIEQPLLESRQFLGARVAKRMHLSKMDV